METRANYAIVGFFTVLVIAAAFGFVYWMANYGRTGQMAPMLVRIPGSANGLSVGSPVRFNGIQVGTVRGLTIDKANPNFVVARTEVRADAPVYKTTKAILEIQGLTGSAYIELSGGEIEGENLLRKTLETGQPATIEAAPSSVTNILSTADRILSKVNGIVDQLDGFTKDARGPLTSTIKNTQTFSKALADNSAGIDKFLSAVSSLSDTIHNLSGRLDSTLASAQKLVEAVDPDQVKDIVSNVDQTSKQIATASAGIDKTLQAFKETADTYRAVGEKAQKTLDRVDTLVAQVDPKKVGEAVDNISRASAEATQSLASVRDLVSAVDPDKVKSIVSNVDKAAGQVATASTGLDQTLQAFRQTADTYRTVGEKAAKTLDRVDALAAGLDPKKVGQTVDNIAAASAEARKSLAQVSKVIEQFDKHTDDIDQTLTNISEMSKKLNAASSRVDAVLAKVNGFLGDGNASSVLADAKSTLKSFKQMADNLNSRIGPIASNVQSFTGSGFKDIQALVGQMRQAVGQIQSSLSSLEQNPQRLIFGGNEVKQYSPGAGGRPRR